MVRGHPWKQESGLTSASLLGRSDANTYVTVMCPIITLPTDGRQRMFVTGTYTYTIAYVSGFQGPAMLCCRCLRVIGVYGQGSQCFNRITLRVVV